MDVIDAEGGKRFLNVDSSLPGSFWYILPPKRQGIEFTHLFQARATVYAEIRRRHPHSQGSTGSKPTYEVETWMLGVHIVERK